MMTNGYGRTGPNLPTGTGRKVSLQLGQTIAIAQYTGWKEPGPPRPALHCVTGNRMFASGHLKVSCEINTYIPSVQCIYVVTASVILTL